jgi:hypothetical protein
MSAITLDYGSSAYLIFLAIFAQDFAEKFESMVFDTASSVQQYYP